MEQVAHLVELVDGPRLVVGVVEKPLEAGVPRRRVARGVLGGAGVVGAAFLAVVYREFTWQRLKDAVYNTLLQSSTVLFLAVASNVFGAVFTKLGTAQVITQALAAIPVPDMGKLIIIMVAIGTKYLAFTTRLGNSAMMQVSSELEEAAWVSGAGRVRGFIRVTMPLLFPTFIAGWIWVAAHAMRNLTFPLLLGTPAL